MSTEGIDAGLAELTSDVLGPVADPAPVAAAPAETEQSGEQPPASPQEPAEPQQPPVASAPAPTATPLPETVEFEGKTYTRDQFKAMLTTASQFGHLQGKYTELKREKEAREAAAARTEPTRIDPAQVKAQIRANFDGAVKASVEQGFMEADFAALYPDLAASVMMYRDSLTAVATIAQTLQEKVNTYERVIAGERTVAEIKNNMVALSTQNAAFAPLSEESTRDQFFEFLVQADPKIDQLRDPEFLIGMWVAFKRNDFLRGADARKTVAAGKQAVLDVQRTRAKGDGATGSRPPSLPAAPKTALDEMVDEFFAR